MTKQGDNRFLHYVVTVDKTGKDGPKLYQMTNMSTYEHMVFMENHMEEYYYQKYINCLKATFNPKLKEKKIKNTESEELRNSLDEMVVSITYLSPHTVQLELNDEKRTKIITFYYSLENAVKEIQKVTDSFFQINTRYVVNYRFITENIVNKKQIYVKGECHRVNKKFSENIEKIKQLQQLFTSAYFGIQGFSAEHDRPERGTGNNTKGFVP